MPVDITVTLTDEQAATALEFARLVRPEATNTELRAELETAAMHGPGIRDVILGWAREAFDRQRDQARTAKRAEFDAVFPPVGGP